MCIGLPMRVVELRDGLAVAERNGVRHAVNALFLPDLRAGAWILAFQQYAVRELEEREAIDIERALTAIAAVVAGETGVPAHFDDILDTEPELPPYLVSHVARR